MANLMPCFLCQRMPTAITINSGGGGHGPWLHLCEFCGERLYVAFRDWSVENAPALKGISDGESKMYHRCKELGEELEALENDTMRLESGDAEGIAGALRKAMHLLREARWRANGTYHPHGSDTA